MKMDKRKEYYQELFRKRIKDSKEKASEEEITSIRKNFEKDYRDYQSIEIIDTHKLDKIIAFLVRGYKEDRYYHLKNVYGTPGIFIPERDKIYTEDYGFQLINGFYRWTQHLGVGCRRNDSERESFCNYYERDLEKIKILEKNSLMTIIGTSNKKNHIEIYEIYLNKDASYPSLRLMGNKE